MGRKKRKGLVARQSGLLKASPSCLHINEQPVFSTRVGAPTHTALPSSCPSLRAVWLSTVYQTPCEGWKDLPPTLGKCPKYTQPPTVQPHRPVLRKQSDKCLSDLRIGSVVLGAQTGSCTRASSVQMGTESLTHTVTGTREKAPSMQRVGRSLGTPTNRNGYLRAGER